MSKRAEAIIRPTSTGNLALDLLNDRFAISRLHPESAIPGWVYSSPFFSVTRSDSELSVVCCESVLPPGLPAERGFRCLRVRGPLDFSETGILESLARPLAEAEVSIFALSTYDTDYILVPHESLETAIDSLTNAGHVVSREHDA